MLPIQFPYRDPAMPDLLSVRTEIRCFLAGDPVAALPAADCVTAFDGAFSERLGSAGWLGLTWPKRYGGSERSAIERFVVLEELLAIGAPVAAHWIAERQIGPMLLRFGTEDQKQSFLPEIAQGKLYFCVGLSEPDTGSDLASLRTKAAQVAGGWRLNGRKVWTSNAHRSQYMVALCRSDAGSARHAGLSQFIVDMKSPGVEVRPILNTSGDHEFNEVVMDDVFVADDGLVGTQGNGWEQVTSELAFERSGPERYMSPFVTLRALAASTARYDADRFATLMARFVALRAMSISVAGMLDEGKLPNLEAAFVKEIGARWEQDVADFVLSSVQCEADPATGSTLQKLVSQTVLHAPSFSIRGGSREIMRNIIARGLEMR